MVKKVINKIVMQIFETFLNLMKIEKKEPSQLFLSEIYKAFTCIPYENATKIINKITREEKFRLPERLLTDYFEYGTGGTCFSLVYTLFKLLQYFKFDSYMVLADRLYGTNTHAAVMVECGNKVFLLDPGFLVPEPLTIPPENIFLNYFLPMNELIIHNEDNHIRVSTIRNGLTSFRYLIKNRAVPEREFFSAWDSSFEFKMINDLFITKLTPDSQIYLRETRVEIITATERKKYIINDNFSYEISKIFGISQKIIEDLIKCHPLKK